MSRQSATAIDTLHWRACAVGTKQTGWLPLASHAGGGEVRLPWMCVRGRKPGKTLLVSACIHGDEFEGPATIWKLFDQLDPETLRGTFVAVPLANPPAYDAGQRMNPADHQDLARVFPGNIAGTVTEQIAHCLTYSFFPHVDFYVDLHSAGQYYAMPPLVGYQLREGKLLETQRAAAKLMGFPLVWGTSALPGRSLSASTDCGVPSLYVETTGQGRCLEADVALYLHGLQQLLAYLEMAEPMPPASPPRWVIEDDSPMAGFLQVQNRCAVGGYFDGEVRAGDLVEEGQRLGIMRDPFGNVLQEITSPHRGLVVFLRTFPRIQPGEPVCNVLELKE